jgi:hypothetical protein
VLIEVRLPIAKSFPLCQQGEAEKFGDLPQRTGM